MIMKTSLVVPMKINFEPTSVASPTPETEIEFVGNYRYNNLWLFDVYTGDCDEDNSDCDGDLWRAERSGDLEEVENIPGCVGGNKLIFKGRKWLLEVSLPM